MSFHMTIVTGRLAGDPVLRYLQSGTGVCNFSIPVNESWLNKDGERAERTTWYKVDIWGKRAEWANEYLRKGSVITVRGTVSSNAWQDNNSREIMSGLNLKALEIQPISDWGKEDNSQGTSSNTQRGRQQSQGSGQRQAASNLDTIPF